MISAIIPVRALPVQVKVHVHVRVALGGLARRPTILDPVEDRLVLSQTTYRSPVASRTANEGVPDGNVLGAVLDGDGVVAVHCEGEGVSNGAGGRARVQ
jgi:hypothetical protein